MNLMKSMEYALCVGTPKASATPVSKRKPRWPAEFRRPVDAALHLGTPRPSHGPAEPTPVYSGPHFFD